METIIGIAFALSLLFNVGQRQKIESQAETLEQKEESIAQLTEALETSIDGANHNASILVETNTELTQCLVVLKESRELQESYRIDAARAQIDNKALEDMLKSTDWGSMRIPDSMDF